MHRLLFDTITPEVIPPDAQAVAGYTSGAWPTYDYVKEHFPHAYRLAICIDARHDGHMLDVEQGDAEASEAPAWLMRQLGRGVGRPVLYASEWTWTQELRPALQKAGIPHGLYRSIIADPRGLANAVARLNEGYDGCQFDWHYLGLNLDATLCRPGFFGPQKPPPLPPILPPPLGV